MAFTLWKEIQQRRPAASAQIHSEKGRQPWHRQRYGHGLPFRCSGIERDGEHEAGLGPATWDLPGSEARLRWGR